MSASPPTRELGFGDGARALFGGVRYVMGTPSAWPLAIVPAIIAMVLVVGTTFGVYSLGSSFVESRLGDQGSVGSLLRVLASALWFVISLIVGLVIGMSLAQPLSAPALDALAKKRARALGVTQFVETSAIASAWRSLRVVTLALIVGLPIVLLLSLIGLIFPPAAIVTLPLKFVVAAWLATWDVFDYAFGLGSLGVRARLSWLTRHGAAAFAFGLALAAVALVPGLGLFVLPMGVAGSTELWVRAMRTP